MTEPLRWGIAATGAIATAFVEDLQHLDDVRIAAVASRSTGRAESFGSRFGIEHRYGSYEALAGDPDVDVVYVATPHAHHAEEVIRFLEAGKHVLCEKPMALNLRQVTAMVDAARVADRFLMEAVWSRFLPAYVQLRELVGSGRIGQVRLVEASFGFAAPFDPSHRLFDPALGGGALLDVGIYPLQLAMMLLGPIAGVQATADLAPTGVDEVVVAVAHHDDGGISISQAATRLTMPCEARVSGSDGWITLPAMMHCAQQLTVHDGRGATPMDASFEGNGLRFQAAEVARSIRDGRRESDVMPLADSIRLAAVMDAARSQIGVRYDADGA